MHLQASLELPLRKWESDLSKAEVSDVESLDAAVLVVIQDEYQISVMLGLKPEQQAQLFTVLQVILYLLINYVCP